VTDHHLEANEVILGGGAAGFPPPAPADPHREAKRLQRLSDGVRKLRTGGGTLHLGERVLLVLAGILAPTGLGLVLLGWLGASRTPNLFEQIPYLISGGLLGLGFVFLGSFFYFAHWLTELVKEHRAQSAAVVEAIGRLEEVIARSATTSSLNGAGHAASSSSAFAPEVPLVATARGTMAHRAECVVVAGKTGLRPVTTDDGLASCKLCDPYGVTVN
jgi:multisubunit Na+/H+ antiporter MnhG subunit